MRSPRLSPTRRTLAHGAWRVVLAGDELVDVRFGGHSVLRGVRAVVRDEHWRTLPPEIVAAHDCEAGGELVSRLGIRYSGWGQSYEGAVTVTLRSQSLRVDFHGRADAAFCGNRIGLVVLHHPDDAGSEVTVTEPSGERAMARFPEEISPHQPLVNIAEMKWHRDGVNVRLRFEGDVFETEDQRNWTDASFKTYGTPLARPFPVEHPAGSVVRQSVTAFVEEVEAVEADDAASAEDEAMGGAVTAGAAPIRVVVESAVAGRVPPIGVAYGTGPAGADFGRSFSQGASGLESLLLELGAPADDLRARAADAMALARRLAVPIDLRIVAADAAELSAALDAVALDGLSLATGALTGVCRIGVYDPVSHVTEPPLWSALTAEAARRGFAGELIAGSRAHFTELNRTVERLPPDAAGVTFSVTPQMHAREVERVVQTLPMQALLLRNAVRLAGGRPVHVGPITLRPRFNAVATSADGVSIPVQDATDELQSDAFTAAWTLGSVAALSLTRASGAAAASISYFHTAGPSGIAAADGAPYPVGRLLGALAPLAGADVLRVTAGYDGVVVYPVRTAAELTVFIANLRDSRQNLEVALYAQADATRIRIVDFSVSEYAVAERGVRPADVRTAEEPDGTLLRVSMDRFTALAVTLPETTPPSKGDAG